MSDQFERVRELLGDALLDFHERCGDETVTVSPETVVECLTRLRDTPEVRMNFLIDLTAVDWPDREPRFEVVYHLASIETEPRGAEPSRLRQRLRVKAGVPEEPCEIDSVVGVFAAANWMEREVFDLYGVRFRGHPDLRRILLYDRFEGHPLRKDYPKRRRQPLLGPEN